MIFYHNCLNQIEAIKALYARYGNCAMQSEKIEYCFDRKMQNSWICMDGNLQLSIACNNPKTLDLPTLCLEVASHIIPSISLQYKYPNDILFQGKKVMGSILINQNTANGKYFIAGIAINLNNYPDDCNAISIREITGSKQNPRHWINKIISKYL